MLNRARWVMLDFRHGHPPGLPSSSLHMQRPHSSSPSTGLLIIMSVLEQVRWCHAPRPRRRPRELYPVHTDVFRTSPPLSSRHHGSLPPPRPRPGYSNTPPTHTDPATSCSSLTSRACTSRFSPLLRSHRGYARSSARRHPPRAGIAGVRAKARARTSRAWMARYDGWPSWRRLAM